MIHTFNPTSLTQTSIFSRIVWLAVATAQPIQVFFSMQESPACHSRFLFELLGLTEPGH